jgi:2-oxoglutarate ferredoxin oxidoreductase subunit alpha
VIGMPLTEICNRTYSDPRQRQLFKNIIYVGALSVLLGMDADAIEQLIGEQYKGKEKLLQPNLEALRLGREYAQQHLAPIGLQVRRADNVGNRIFVDGNSAAALGCVYGGATVCAWYPITPSSSLAEAFQKYCGKFRADPETGRAAPRSSRPKTNSRRSAWWWAPAGTARGPSRRRPARASR